MKILRFTANWCVPCKQLAKTLEMVSLDIPIEVVDVDTYPKLAELYGVRSVPTLVLESETPITTQQGSTYPRLIGSKNIKEILSWISDNA